MKDLGPARVFLGIEMKRKRNKKQLFISQSEYAKEVYERFGMSDSKSVAILTDKSYHECVKLKNRRLKTFHIAK